MNSVCFDSKLIKKEAQRLGFHTCGIAPIQPVDIVHSNAFRQWIANGQQAGMHYLAQHMDIRFNPALLMEQARSIIVVTLNYYPRQQLSSKQYQFAWYAYGKDYHTVVKDKLQQLSNFISQHYADAKTRICCDTAPLLEKYWAWQAGLGWIGKHTQLVIPNAGSCFFLGEIIINMEANNYDQPATKHCGKCRQCIDSCPQKAIEAPYKLNAARCMSYLTIEHRGEFPHTEKDCHSSYIYGCDECLKACPWLKFATPCNIPELQPTDIFMAMQPEDWNRLSIEQYRSLFKGSAVKRAKYEGLMRNIRRQQNKNNSQ